MFPFALLTSWGEGEEKHGLEQGLGSNTKRRVGEQAGGMIGKSAARMRTILGESKEQGRGGGSRSGQDLLLARRTGRNTNLDRVHYSAFKTCPSQESPRQSPTSRLVGSLR